MCVCVVCVCVCVHVLFLVGDWNLGAVYVCMYVCIYVVDSRTAGAREEQGLKAEAGAVKVWTCAVSNHTFRYTLLYQ